MMVECVTVWWWREGGVIPEFVVLMVVGEYAVLVLTMPGAAGMGHLPQLTMSPRFW